MRGGREITHPASPERSITMKSSARPGRSILTSACSPSEAPTARSSASSSTSPVKAPSPVATNFLPGFSRMLAKTLEGPLRRRHPGRFPARRLRRHYPGGQHVHRPRVRPRLRRPLQARSSPPKPLAPSAASPGSRGPSGRGYRAADAGDPSRPRPRTPRLRLRQRPELVGSAPSWEEVYAKDCELVAEERRQTPEIPCEVRGIRIGPLGVAANGSEYFCEHSLRIKKCSSFDPARVVTLANEYIGYVRQALGRLKV